MLCLLVGGRDESNDESKIRRALHREAGSLPGLHPYLRLHVRTSTRRCRHPAPLPCHPPTVHQMIVTLERNAFIRRQPGVPRSIEILVPPESLPILEWLGIKTSKS